ncbi:hypothetical protein D3C81_1835750 [compost metagenome]
MPNLKPPGETTISFFDWEKLHNAQKANLDALQQISGKVFEAVGKLGHRGGDPSQVKLPLTWARLQAATNKSEWSWFSLAKIQSRLINRAGRAGV